MGIDEKSKPYSHVGGIYTPSSNPNFQPYQSREWYAHESLMEQERQTAL